jgi:hypothetical protein
MSGRSAGCIIWIPAFAGMTGTPMSLCGARTYGYVFASALPARTASSSSGRRSA